MDKKFLTEIKTLYKIENKSVSEISKIFNCSENKINYWMEKHNIKKRTISEAIYLKHNPNGDPFKFRYPKNKKEAELFGIGIGLYWGEGTKANKTAVRLGNSDPILLEKFMNFLKVFFSIDKNSLRFHLHIFSDIKLEDALSFWTKKLKIKRYQFYKPIITKTGKLGTYRKKSKFGVVTVYYNNKKARDLLNNLLPL